MGSWYLFVNFSCSQLMSNYSDIFISSYPETQASEVPAAAQMDGPDLVFPMSPQTSKSRMSMKLRRSSGSANKT
ncbi:UNVERIFIED_CONTAM: hypothetical protein K2H54_041309 [Gekko kuhli]